MLQQSEHRLLPASRSRPSGRGRSSAGSSGPLEHEDLPYRVELWNPERTSVEQVLAITANASIGYSAFYAAARDYFDRYITLRHKASIINRWNGPPH
ncbi:MAG TPA: hypothetical protein VGM17_04755 [Rhizomicrobium sp.]